VGKQTAQKLEVMGIESIGDLAHFNKDVIAGKLGKQGIEIHEHANGIDNDPVVPHSHDEMKSIGRSVTLAEDISDLETAKTILLKLTDEVGMTARNYDKKGRKVQITIKYSDFKVITRQTTLQATYLTKDIYSAGIKLLENNWSMYRTIRLLGISLSGFDEDCEMDQISLFQTYDTTQPEVKEEKLEKAIDAIRNKHGLTKLNRAIFLKREI
jgi:DNA polymerase-4